MGQFNAREIHNTRREAFGNRVGDGGGEEFGKGWEPLTVNQEIALTAGVEKLRP